MRKFKTLAFSFFLGSTVLCCLSLFQKLLFGFPLFLHGFITPFIAGGSFGLLVGMRSYWLSKINEQLVKEIDEHKQTEQALLESEERHRIFVDNAIDAFYLSDMDGRFIDANKAACTTLGYTYEELLGMTISDVDVNYPSDKLSEILGSLNHNEPRLVESIHKKKDGTIFPVDVRIRSIGPKEEPLLLSFARDITGSKEAEKALREGEERLWSVFRAAPTGIGVVIDRVLKEVNARLCEMTGYSKEELINQSARILYPTVEDYDYVGREKYEQIRDHGTGTVETHWKRKDGRIVDILLSSTPMDLGDLSKGVTFTALDITKRKRVEEALLESEEKYRSMMEAMKDPVYICSPDYRVEYMNPAMIKRTGCDATGESCFKALHNLDEKCPWCKHNTPQHHAHYELDIVSPKDNHSYHISNSPIVYRDGLVSRMIVLRDTTELKEMEAQLQRAQKMEAIGTLAGGVAHDLNNVLSAQVSYPDLILMDLSEDSPLRKPILTIQESGKKAAAIVQDLLTLARRGVVATEVVNLNNIIDDYIESPECENLKEFYTGVKIESDLEPYLLNIMGSSVHLSKTVTNLVSNAAEAMPNGGNIFISTQSKYIDKPIRGYDDVKEGDYVILTVSDTGTGISSGDLERIFEPFYTKKVMGRSGTGLGMAVVWGTVKDHKGYIDVQSTEGKGTTVTLYFPVTRKETGGEKESLLMEEYMGKGESILVVDDVEEQREIATRILNKLGYSVTSVSSGEEAVDYLKNNSADLLVLDMIMDPGIDGLETYKRILELHSGQKAIIASGFSETDRVKEAQRLGAGKYIKKPYTLEKIGLAVKEEFEK